MTDTYTALKEDLNRVHVERATRHPHLVTQISHEAAEAITTLQSQLAEARADALEEAAGIADNIGKEWHTKSQQYRKDRNNGPYLGQPSGFSIAKAIRALKDQSHV